MSKNALLTILLCTTVVAGLPSCGLPSYDVLVRVEGELPPAGITTDLGYTVRLTEARMAVGELHFIGAAETTGHSHGSHEASEQLSFVLDVKRAIDLTADGGTELGSVSLRKAYYSELHLAIVTTGDDATIAGVGPEDALHGHALYLKGTASRGGADYPFTITLDLQTEVMGIPLSLHAEEDDLEFHLAINPLTWFNGVDFAGLADANGEVSIASGSGAAATVEGHVLDTASFLHEAEDHDSEHEH